MLWLLAQLIWDGGEHNFHLKRKCRTGKRKPVKLWPFPTNSVQKLEDAEKTLIYMN